MPHPLHVLLTRRSLAANVRRALAAGVGLYERRWEVGQNLSGAAFAGELVAWCREIAGEMRRPYGLDYVTLAIACLDGEGVELARASFGVLRPADLYGADGLEARIAGAIHAWHGDAVVGLRHGCSLVAALFSWGDLTRELLPAT